MEFRVLGPVEVRVDGEVVPIPALRQRALFALLLIHAGGVLSADRIIEALWGDELPASGANALRFHVSKLRSALGADPSPIVTQDGGYALVVDPGSIDANRFEQLLGESLEEMRDDPHRAAALVGEALELWRGDPYAGLGDPGFVDGEVRRLTELRFKAVEVGFAADLALGRHAEIIGDLESMQAEFPFRERLWAHLMVAFYRSGRQAEALRAYQRASEVLGEELGIEPSEELRELENRILLHDPTLDYAPVIPGNLPSPPGSFIGRESELAEVEELLEANRLVTLTGAGGSGKTRLAAELGQVAKRNWSDGVWFVDLRSIDDPADIPSLVASTMRVVVSGDLPIVDQVADALRSRSLLLILDNCERVLDRTAALTERLLREDGDVRVLATSREPLGVPGEVVHIVTPLPVPGEEGLDDPTGYPSVQLFAARARYVRSGFDVGDHVGAVSRICRAVDGLPLAL
ncbi:MAG: BTAD domain-containing putative transcriptional regulator, partial [Actinomycetota bacterium]